MMATVANVLRKRPYAAIAIVISLALGTLFWALTFQIEPNDRDYFTK